MSAFDKLEYELYAPLSLLQSFPQFVPSPVKGESPDWWDVENGIGMEVARAENPHIGYTKSLSNRFLGKRKANIPEKKLREFPGKLWFSENRLYAVSDSKGLFDGVRHISLALEMTKEKLIKLNEQHFMCFQTNCLYLYLTMSLVNDDASRFMTECKKLVAAYERYYAHIFLMAFDCICHVDVTAGRIESCELSHSTIDELDKTVHMLRSISNWETGTVFMDVLKLM